MVGDYVKAFGQVDFNEILIVLKGRCIDFFNALRQNYLLYPGIAESVFGDFAHTGGYGVFLVGFIARVIKKNRPVFVEKDTVFITGKTTVFR